MPAALAYVRRGLHGCARSATSSAPCWSFAPRANPTRFGGRDLIAAIMRHRRSDGSFDGYVSYTSFAILRCGARAEQLVGHDPQGGALDRAPPELRRRLQRRRPRRSGIDDTASAAQALVSRPAARRAVASAATFLARQQGAQGGFPLTPRRRAQRAVHGLRGRRDCVAAGGRRGAARPRAGLHALADASRNGLVRYSRTGAPDAGAGSAPQALLALIAALRRGTRGPAPRSP